MVRVAFGGISHETNTFATASLGPTTLAHFRPRTGDEITRIRGGYTGGMLTAARELGYECVGTLFGITEPSGTIVDAAFESMRDGLCDRLRASLPVDVVALEMHGAGVAESYPDIEGELARAVRAVVGPRVPIVGTFDLHGNISPECAAAFDFMCCVHEYPHTDMYERGLEAMRLVPRLLAGLRTAVHLEQVPALLPLCMMCTQEGFPAHEMKQFMYELERRPGVIDCTVFHGFPWADIPIVGASVLVTTDNDPALARAVGREAGAWLWRNRARFQLRIAGDGRATGAGDAAVTSVDAHTPASAVAAARSSPDSGRRGPVVINEASDNTGCGAPGDATHLLRAMIAADFAPGEACFGWMYDPQVLKQALDAGVGAKISVSLGGKMDPETCGAPVEAQATVRTITDGRFQAIAGSMGAGFERRLGKMARLRIGNVDVLVNARRSQVFCYGAFPHAGIDVLNYRVVGLKSATHFRAGWAPVASRIITCEAPGWSSNDLHTFEPVRKHGGGVARWPTAAGVVYPPGAAAKL